MDGPSAPMDANLRNIIDKLAEFVARNGPEFELITKQKQQGNSKFEFLYGGEYASYYQYRVAAEQTFLKQQGSLSQGASAAHVTNYLQPAASPPKQQQIMHESGGSIPAGASDSSGAPYVVLPSTTPVRLWNSLPTLNASPNHSTLKLTAQIEAINMQQNTLREHIRQSEANLSAQHSALMVIQNKEIDDAIEDAQNLQLEKLAETAGISLKEFDNILQPIMESCTKDSISAGKNWILQHSSDCAKNNVVLQYLLKKALVNGSTFLQKLHLIYLVNDILHHCARKSVSELKNSLENVVIPMFCSADLIANSEQRPKLAKLLQLWEAKAKFFDACVITKLQTPDSSMKEHRNNLLNQHPDIVAKYSQITKSTMENYQKQHQLFIQHATQQIAQLEQQKQLLEQQIFAAVLPSNNMLQTTTAATTGAPSPSQSQTQQTPVQNNPAAAAAAAQSQQNAMTIPSLMSQKITPPAEADHTNAEHLYHAQTTTAQSHANESNSNINQTMHNLFPTVNNANNYNANNNASNIPEDAQQQKSAYNALDAVAGNMHSNFFIPDLSKPPPGFSAPNLALSVRMPIAQHHPGQFGGRLTTPRGNAALITNVQAGNMATNIDFNAAAAIHLAQQQQHYKQQQQQQIQQPHFQQQQQIQIQEQLQQQPNQQQQRQHPRQPQVRLQQTPNLQYPHLPIQPSNNHFDVIAGATSPLDGEESFKPNIPYYDLPAGLMVPLIRLDDYNYKPLDPENILLPAPQPATERLTAALSAFYAPPTHDRPRDTDGWEKLGLYEYYKIKNAARKQKEDEIRQELREKSKSCSPILLETQKKKKVTKKRIYRSRSRSRSKEGSVSRSSSPSRSPRSRSRSPSSSRGCGNSPSPLRGRSSRNSRYAQRANSSRSPSCRDRERESSVGASSNGSRDNRIDRSTRKERERSPTPPSFMCNNFPRSNEFIGESNKGHQMLMKMGWAGTGTGLGSNNQGIGQPIASGDVRDRKDMFKGVGINLNDPFENFRKNKGAAFVHRMRARDDKT